ncbi:minor tail protein T [Shigella dysenteriae 225-75]|nr:minor tail protein T [Shigella dysenteriae 225-75]
MRLAREFRRADWRRMLSEMSATELGEGAIISGCRASVMCGWMRSLPR